MSNRFRRRLIGLVAAIAVLGTGFGTFLIARELHSDPDASAQAPVPQPADGSTPIAGATPDRSQPNWYVPYLNVDQQKPRFTGLIAGVEIRQLSTSDVRSDPGRCSDGEKPDSLGGSDARASLDRAGLGMPELSLINAVPKGDPTALICAGAARMGEQDFRIGGGSYGTPADGGMVSITRTAVGNAYYVGGPSDRWSERIVEGHKVAVLEPVIDTIGNSAVLFLNGSGGLTALVGTNVTTDLLLRIAAEVLR
jgi:hypothetical protein